MQRPWEHVHISFLLISGHWQKLHPELLRTPKSQLAPSQPKMFTTGPRPSCPQTTEAVGTENRSSSQQGQGPSRLAWEQSPKHLQEGCGGIQWTSPTPAPQRQLKPMEALALFLADLTSNDTAAVLPAPGDRAQPRSNWS